MSRSELFLDHSYADDVFEQTVTSTRRRDKNEE